MMVLGRLLAVFIIGFFCAPVLRSQFIGAALGQEFEEGINWEWERGRRSGTFSLAPGKGASLQNNNDRKKKSKSKPAYILPIEPHFPKVTFLKQSDFANTQDRVDRLIHGIYTYIPPEYDHYGYEMRRYMSSIGNIAIFSDKARFEKELHNMRTAKIIMRYWRESIGKEMKAIKEIIEKGNVSPQTKASFKYNKAIVIAFLIECQSWIDNNGAVMDFLDEKQGLYELKDYHIEFDFSTDLQKFINLYKAREEALKHINEYLPFMTMIY